MLYPRHGEGEVLFVAPLRCEIEEVVRADGYVKAAGIGRVRVENISSGVFVKRTEAGPFFNFERDRVEIVVWLALFDVRPCERNFVVEIEVVLVRREPFKFPAHALLECLNLRERRARNDKEGDVARVQVRNGAVKMIGEQGTARATFDPVRAEHEMIDQELAAAGEEIGESFFAVWPIEDVVLFHFFPGKFATLLAEFVAETRKFLFFFKEGGPSCEPLVVRYNFFVDCCTCYHVR